MKFYLLIFYLVFCLTGRSQEEMPLSPSDSVSLSNTWEKLAKAITARNKPQLRQLSVPLIDCQVCSEIDSNFVRQFVSPDRFFEMIFALTKTTNLATALQSKDLHVGVTKFVDFQPNHSGLKDGEDFIMYHASVKVESTSTNANQTPHKNEGAYIFQFVKKSGRFMFYGFDTLP
ncbi:MAG: hypothetical protein V4635_09635 [Bacteroidota bacterium]